MNTKIKTSLALCLSAAALFTFSSARADDVKDLKADAQNAKEGFMRADASLSTFFNDAAGYAVFPNVGKGGLVVGGAHGKGVVYQKEKAIGQASLTQASVGAQVGGQTFAELIFFESAAALEDFKEGKFEMTADVSAVVAGEGAAKSARYKHGVAVFAMPKKGLMAQAAIGGQKFKFEPMAMEPTGRTPKSN